MVKKDKKYRYLLKQDLNKLYDIYYTNKKSIIQNKGTDETKQIIKMIREIIDNKVLNDEEVKEVRENNKNYSSYPDFNDPDFVY